MHHYSGYTQAEGHCKRSNNDDHWHAEMTKIQTHCDNLNSSLFAARLPPVHCGCFRLSIRPGDVIYEYSLNIGSAARR